MNDVGEWQESHSVRTLGIVIIMLKSCSDVGCANCFLKGLGRNLPQFLLLS